ncbi:MAG: 3-phosphoshikimate 1-carboxyvinyltransferase [Actinomycetota bacterium]
MRVVITPSPLRSADVTVPGDKSIAHRWLMLAAVADGASELGGLPAALDVRSTSRCLAEIVPSARESLSEWAGPTRANPEVPGFTWDTTSVESPNPPLRIEGQGWRGLAPGRQTLDCGNSGTTMRLLMGLLAAGPGDRTFKGDESLSRRPMERVAGPLRRMGADISTTKGVPPVRLRGTPLRGADETLPIASSQVKSAILLAGLRAEGTTTVRQTPQTRDHTERALRHLGADVSVAPGEVTIAASDLPSFRGALPGDPSSAAFLLVASAISSCALRIAQVGLNPTRTAFLDILRAAGCEIEERAASTEVGEPAGELILAPRSNELRGVTTSAEQFPLLADELPALAILAAAAEDPSRFTGVGELRVKESDRLRGIVDGLRALGADAEVEEDDLLVAGGGIRGGHVDGGSDHRLAMAFAVAGTAAREETSVDGIEAAEVSFPGFVGTLHELGAETDIR